MSKNIIYTILALFICLSCEEIYKPDLNDEENFIVIEALITNNMDLNVVKITKTQDFYDKSVTPKVSGAIVELVDENGNSFFGEETSAGVYKMNFSTVIGTKYKLVVAAEGEIYESDFELMPSLPLPDTVYAEADTLQEYRFGYLGVPYLINRTGCYAYIDLSVTDSLSRYRFDMDKTLEWTIPPPDGSSIATYGWLKFDVSDIFNIAGPSEYGNEDIIKKHALTFMGNRDIMYLTDETIEAGAYLVGWLVEVNEYGMSDETYNYYESINNQLEANGKLFDPVYAQLISNMTCKSNPDKKVAGYFELSSHRYFRFFAMNYFSSARTYFHMTDNAAEILPTDTIDSASPPLFWETSSN